jgi:hypothetical protein
VRRRVVAAHAARLVGPSEHNQSPLIASLDGLQSTLPFRIGDPVTAMSPRRRTCVDRTLILDH